MEGLDLAVEVPYRDAQGHDLTLMLEHRGVRPAACDAYLEGNLVLGRYLGNLSGQLPRVDRGVVNGPYHSATAEPHIAGYVSAAGKGVDGKGVLWSVVLGQKAGPLEAYLLLHGEGEDPLPLQVVVNEVLDRLHEGDNPKAVIQGTGRDVAVVENREVLLKDRVVQHLDPKRFRLLPALGTYVYDQPAPWNRVELPFEVEVHRKRSDDAVELSVLGYDVEVSSVKEPVVYSTDFPEGELSIRPYTCYQKAYLIHVGHEEPLKLALAELDDEVSNRVDRVVGVGFNPLGYLFPYPFLIARNTGNPGYFPQLLDKHHNHLKAS